MTVTTAYPPGRVGEGAAIKIMPGKNDVKGVRFRPTRVAILARGNTAATYSSTKRRIYSKYDVSSVEGFGCPAHLIATHLFDYGIGDIEVTLYPLDLASTAASGSITPSGSVTKTQTYYVKVNNMFSDAIIVEAGDTVSVIIDKMVLAINAVQDMPVIASDGTTTCTITAKWDGTLGNNIHLEAVSPVGGEVSFALTQPTGGAGVPDITAALEQMGEVWETHVITDLDYSDSAELNEFQTFGQGGDGFGGRRHPEVHKPLTVYTGSQASRSTLTTVTDNRKSDMTNVIVPNPASNDLPFVIAAGWVREIAKQDALDPAMDYIGKKLSGLTPGPDGSQWNSSERDSAVKMGCSTVTVRDGVVCISDTVTCYHPTGEDPPLFRYVCDIAKDGAIINELDLTITPLKAKPLIPDNQATTNPNAIKPKSVKGMLAGIANRIGLAAIIADPDWTIENSYVGIGTTNPKRLDIIFKASRSGNTNVISMDVPVSFYFGG